MRASSVPPAQVKRLEDFESETVEPKLGLFERTAARLHFGFLLWLIDVPDASLANNPYSLACSLGLRDQLKMTSADLRRAWDAVTDEQLRRAANKIFAAERQAGAFIAIEK